MMIDHAKVVLSFLLTESAAWNRLSYLNEECFASDPHRRVFRAMCEMHARRQSITLLSLQDYLTESGELDKVGGAAELTSLQTLEGVNQYSADYAAQELIIEAGEIAAAKVGKLLVGGAITPSEACKQLETIGRNAQPWASRITVRSVEEILKMSLDQADCILGDRLLAKGQPLVIAGQGGIGKTRLSLQLAVACITGRKWCGFETHAMGLRWLILQTENSNRRLQSDLAPLKAWVGSEDWNQVNDLLRVHTLETDTDTMLSLADPAAVRELQNLIQIEQPDVITIDPLRDFAIGDLNSDEEMTATLRELGRICRLGNPHRAIVILHHALTGRSGAAKAFGLDRSGFARNSKTLQTWTRGQINIIPGAAEDNETLVITCGKNSNGREFSPVAVQLDLSSMIYDVDGGFDMDSWREQVCNASASKKRAFRPEIVRDITEPGKKLKKQEIAKLLMDDTGCGKSRAYELVNEAKTRGILNFNRRDKTYELAA